jgi:hypothetical protein
MGVLETHFVTTRWPKNFFSVRNRFFLGEYPREANEFLSTTVVFSVLLPVRTPWGPIYSIFSVAIFFVIFELQKKIEKTTESWKFVLKFKKILRKIPPPFFSIDFLNSNFYLCRCA